MAVSAMDDANVGRLFFSKNTFPVTKVNQMVNIHILHPANPSSADVAGVPVFNPRHPPEIPPMLRVQVDLTIPDAREEYPKLSCHSR